MIFKCTKKDVKRKNKKQPKHPTFRLIKLLVCANKKGKNMGMYTEIHFNSKLKKDVPQNIIEILQYMVDLKKEPENLPEHELFKCSRWSSLFVCDSYCFDADTHSTFRFDDISNTYCLCVRANLKNYDSEIEKFINWIMPYLDKYEGNFLGFYRYRESEQPDLIYHKAN